MTELTWAKVHGTLAAARLEADALVAKLDMIFHVVEFDDGFRALTTRSLLFEAGMLPDDPRVHYTATPPKKPIQRWPWG